MEAQLSSAEVRVSDEDQDAEAPTALRGTLLKSAEEYH